MQRICGQADDGLDFAYNRSAGCHGTAKSSDVFLALSTRQQESSRGTESLVSSHLPSRTGHDTWHPNIHKSKKFAEMLGNLLSGLLACRSLVFFPRNDYAPDHQCHVPCRKCSPELLCL